jgi:hypothetical protein
MDYVSGGLKGENGVLKVEEQAAVAYAGSAVAGWGGGDAEDVDVGIDLDDDEAFEAEAARLEGILIERGILKPEGGAAFDPDNFDDLENLEIPDDVPPGNLKELYRMLDEGLTDLAAGRVYTSEELRLELRREELKDLRRMVENGHV